MEKFLQMVGWVGVGAVIVLLLAVMASAGRGPNAALAFVASLTWALPSAIGFVLIAAFGAMLAQLKAIRIASDLQAKALQELIDRRVASGQR